MKEKKICSYTTENKVGTKLFAQLLRGGWKLAKTTSRRDKNKAPEMTQNIFEGKLFHKIALSKTF